MRRRRSSAAMASALALLAIGNSVAGLQSRRNADATERVSVATGGGQGNGVSAWPAVNQDGRFVCFASQANNLVPGDTNGVADIFLRDRQAGKTERVNINDAGEEANAVSSLCAVSGGGRFVAFASLASNLVPFDPNHASDIFVRDRVAGTTEAVSVSGGVPANGESYEPSISSDGRFVAFESDASDLVWGDTNGVTDVFVRDRQLGFNQRVSVSSSGEQGQALSHLAAISTDGRHVAFESFASNLVPGDTNGFGDAFVHDLDSGVTERVSVNSAGQEVNFGGGDPAIGSEGRFVAFHSLSSQLVPGDTNDASDVFVRDRSGGTTERVSVDSSGGEGNGSSQRAAISGDGRFVVFDSFASNLAPGDANGQGDVFVHDLQTAATVQMSVNSSGRPSQDGTSVFPVLSGDGAYAAFISGSTDLVPSDTNGETDVFIHRRHAPQIYAFSPASGKTGSAVTIEGANFEGVKSVMLGNRKAKFKALSPDQLLVTVPNATGSASFTARNADGTAESSSDYIVTFSIMKLMPSSGPVGTMVTLTGVGFTDVTSVRFHGIEAAFTVVSPTSIQATVPTGAKTGTVTATSPQGTVAGPKFKVTP